MENAIQGRKEEKKESKNNPDFELEEADAQAEEEKREKGAPHHSQGSGVTYWLQLAVRDHVYDTHVEMCYTRNKI